MSSGPERTEWEQGWGGHEAQQRQRLSKLPLTETLRWLEEAHHLVLHLAGAAPDRDTSLSPAVQDRSGDAIR